MRGIRPGCIMTCMLIALLTLPAAASIEKPRSAEPTGCRMNAFELGMEARPEWGIVPFKATFDIWIAAGTDSVESVTWDFESDGKVDAAGSRVSHIFTTPTDHIVTATVKTRYRGVFKLQRKVTGHTAVMSLTFDDGKIGVYYEALPILRDRGLTATTYVVPAWVNGTHSQYMDWEHIEELYEAGWDIGSHTVNHVDLTTVDDSTLHYELRESRAEIGRHGIPAPNFALPYGAYDDRVMEAVKIYYCSSRAVESELNPAPEDTDAYMMKCMTSQHWYPLEYYQAHIDSVVSTGAWYILNNHSVRYYCNGAEFCIDASMLADIVDYALDRRVKVASIDDALKYAEQIRSNHRTARELMRDNVDPPPIVWTFRNPFNVPGPIEFHIRDFGISASSIYDCLGRHIRQLECKHLGEDRYATWWDGKNEDGKAVATGTYYCIVTADGARHSSGPILILK